MKIIRFTNSLMARTIQEIKNTDKLKGVQWQRFRKLNDLLKGFRDSEMTVLSGRTGVGKSTFLCEYCLDLAEQQVPTLIGSFEMPLHKVCKMLLYQFSRSPLHLETDFMMERWTKLFETLPLYYIDQLGSVENTRKILEVMHESVDEYKVRHILIDNVQFLLGSKGTSFSDQFVQQDRFIQAVRMFVNETKCHTTLVIHPRKEDVSKLLTINSLYGGGKISQEADNVLLLQDESTLPDVAYPKRFIQVVKNRYDGQLGRMELRFNRESKTYSTGESKFFQNKQAVIQPTAREINDDRFG